MAYVHKGLGIIDKSWCVITNIIATVFKRLKQIEGSNQHSLLTEMANSILNINCSPVSIFPHTKAFLFSTIPYTKDIWR